MSETRTQKDTRPHQAGVFPCRYREWKSHPLVTRFGLNVLLLYRRKNWEEPLAPRNRLRRTWASSSLKIRRGERSEGLPFLSGNSSTSRIWKLLINRTIVRRIGGISTIPDRTIDKALRREQKR